MHIQSIMDLDQQVYMNTFGPRIPVAFDHGQGVTLVDTEGKAYTDFFGGIAVNALGYGYPSYTAALHAQVDKLLHTSSVYYIENQARLAAELVQHTFCDRVFFSNSGAEANEGAVKLVRKYWKLHDPKRYKVLSLQHSFHGRTLAMVAATGQEKYQKPYTPLPAGFVNVEPGDLSAMEAAIDEETAAIFLEVIQGEGGVQPLDAGYLAGIQALCQKYGLLLVIDEVQTGMGRTGKLLASEHYPVQPDIVTLAKALGGGVPIGAILATEKVASSFTPGDHGTTFGGNPLACAAGLAVFHALYEEGVLARSVETGDYLAAQLQALARRHPAVIQDVRGRGMMWGLALSPELPATTLVKSLLTEGFVTGTAAGNTLRLLPPLIITPANVDALVAAMDKILNA